MGLNISKPEKIFPTGSWYNLITIDDRDLPDVIACFFLTGLQKNEKCILYSKTIDKKSLLDSFSSIGIDGEAEIKAGMFKINEYNKEDNSIVLEDIFEDLLKKGCSGIRIASDFSCSPKRIGLTDEQKAALYKNSISYISFCNADKIGVGNLLDVVEDTSDFILVYNGKLYVHNDNIGLGYEDVVEMASPVLLQMLIDRQRLKRENDILELLNDTAGEVTYSGGPERVLNIILNKMMDICMADMGALNIQKNYIVKSQEDITTTINVPVMVLSGLPGDMCKELRLKIDEVVKHGQCILTEDSSQLNDSCRKFMDQQGITSAIAVPIRLKNKNIGYIFLASKRPGYSFKEKATFLLDSMNIMASILYNQNKLFEVYNEMYEAQKMKALGVMTSGIAHEFNNLLTPILGFAQIIRKKVDSPDLKMYVDMIENSAKDGAMIVKRVQEFTRRQDKDSREKFDLNMIIMEVIKMTKPRWKNEAEAMGKKISIKGESKSSKFVLINPSEIREVITNILFNAVDAIQTEGVVTIKTWDKGDKVFFSIEDDGVGMSKEVLANIYTPFFTTKKERGTGLGLSIVYNILHDHGGSINVKSKQGKGTKVEMWLPATGMEREDQQGSDELYGKYDGKVLVVDGYDTAGRTAGSILTEFGFNADIVSNGQQALKVFTPDKYRFVLCDLAMDDMTGIELAKRIKSIDSAVWVILMSGWAADIPEKDMKQVDFILKKPFSMHAMHNVVNEALNSKTKCC